MAVRIIISQTTLTIKWCSTGRTQGDGNGQGLGVRLQDLDPEAWGATGPQHQFLSAPSFFPFRHFIILFVWTGIHN